ncbi:hypothetical protein YB2330_000095 [Saitoella coloradoensis]
MEAVKNLGKELLTPDNPFQPGHQQPVQQQSPPGLETKMNPSPIYDQLPVGGGLTDEKGQVKVEKYRASGKLEGRKALITGGDSGIGRSVAILYALEGADVAIVYLPEEQEDAAITQSQVIKAGHKCVLIPTDIQTEANCISAVERTVSELGGLDILVNNAGYQMEQLSIEDITEAQLDRTFRTNIYSQFFLTKAALKHIPRGGAIINCASVNHYKGHPKLLDYTATKGAIVAFTRALSQQIADKGVRVNAVAPGPIWTPLVVATMGKESLDGFSGVPLGRAGQPSEVATCFVFLAGPDSSFMTGQTLHPNGGTVVNG